MAVSITNKFLNELKKADNAFDKRVAAGENDFNIFDALGVYQKENVHTDFIAYLLNYHDSRHYQTIFAKAFIEKLIKEKAVPDKIFKTLDETKLKSVVREASTQNIKAHRRMDILLSFDDNINIIIENKISADDQENQLKDYIENVHKNVKGLNDTEKANRTLVIYLHPDKDAEPSEKSFGKTSNRIQKYWKLDKSGQYTQIRDGNNTIKAYYFKMDYKWIESWIQSCVKELEKSANGKARGEPKTRGENGLNKIIFGLKQYIEIIKWHITSKRQETNDIVEYILKDSSTTRMALEIFRDKSNENYESISESISSSWNEVSERIVERFYNKLKQQSIKINNTQWECNRTDEHITATNKPLIRIIPKQHIGKPIYYAIRCYLSSNFSDLTLDLALIERYQDDNEAKRYESVSKECQKCFPYKAKEASKFGIAKQGNSYQKTILEFKGTESFANWIIDKGNNAIEEFIAIINKFATIQIISNIINECDEAICKNNR